MAAEEQRAPNPPPAPPPPSSSSSSATEQGPASVERASTTIPETAPSSTPATWETGPDAPSPSLLPTPATAETGPDVDVNRLSPQPAPTTSLSGRRPLTRSTAPSKNTTAISLRAAIVTASARRAAPPALTRKRRRIGLASIARLEFADRVTVDESSSVVDLDVGVIPTNDYDVVVEDYESDDDTGPVVEETARASVPLITQESLMEESLREDVKFDVGFEEDRTTPEQREATPPRDSPLPQREPYSSLRRASPVRHEPEVVSEPQPSTEALPPRYWMFGGPRSEGLLLHYEHHIARAIYERTPLVDFDAPPPLPTRQPRRRARVAQADPPKQPPTTDDDATVVGAGTSSSVVPEAAALPEQADANVPRDLTGKVLKTYARTPYFASFEDMRGSEPLSWYPIAERSGLTGLRELDAAYTSDAALISAFVERWHPETNSFHFTWGEMTITLHDVLFILGLPIHGTSCVSREEWTDEAIKARLTAEFGMDDEKWRKWGKAGGVPCEEVKKKMKDWMDAAERDESQIASYYLFLLVVSTILVDKTTNAGKRHILGLLYDHGVTGEYAWGAGVLAYMYRQLGEASRREASTIGGCNLLIRSWIYAYFPHFRNNAIINTAGLSDQRAAVRESRPLEAPDSKSAARLRAIRLILDDASFSEVVWQPWGTPRFDDELIAPSLFRGIIRLNDIAEPYMPDRVLRQFGRTQRVPIPPITPRMCKRGPTLKKESYVVVFPQEMLGVWDQIPRPLLQLSESDPPPSHSWDVTLDYLDFIEEYMHVIIDPNTPALQRRERDRRPHTVDTVARSQIIAGEMRTYLQDPSRLPGEGDELVARWLAMLTDVTPPAAPVLPCALRFRDSQFERESESRGGPTGDNDQHA